LQSAGLNAEQFQVANAICNYAIRLQEWRRNSDESHFPIAPKIFIHGGPGVGKTYLSRTIHRVLRQHLGEESLGIQGVAFTGVAAYLIPNGRTFHSFFQLLVGQPYIDLSVGNKAVMRAKIDRISAILIDEVSMVSPDLLAQADQRLRSLYAGTVRGNVDFGGVCVILQGDMFQLSPVRTMSQSCCAIIYCMT
jgi:hypothetical protein